VYLTTLTCGLSLESSLEEDFEALWWRIRALQQLSLHQALDQQPLVNCFSEQRVVLQEASLQQSASAQMALRLAVQLVQGVDNFSVGLGAPLQARCSHSLLGGQLILQIRVLLKLLGHLATTEI
jgi:hypothetical protein